MATLMRGRNCNVTFRTILFAPALTKNFFSNNRNYNIPMDKATLSTIELEVISISSTWLGLEGQPLAVSENWKTT